MLGKENIKNNTISIDSTRERLIFKDPVTSIDEDWIKSKFMLSMSQLDSLEDVTIYGTSADRKITNTSLGMSLAINAPYAFTRYTDPPVPGRVSGNKHFKVADMKAPMGMGTYYSKAIDDNNSTSLLFLTPGVVEFSSLISVFTRATDYKTSVIANEGRYPTLFDVGDWIGTGVMALFFPVRSLLVYAVKEAAKTLPIFSDHSYYHVKPTPAQYWLMVQNITNSLASERGILSLNLKPNGQRIGGKYKYDQYRMNYLIKHFPLLFNKSGGVNVFSVATRAQKNISKQLRTEFLQAGKLKNSNFEYTYPQYPGKGSDPAAASLEDIASTITLDPGTELTEFIKKALEEPITKESKEEAGLPRTNENPPEENPNDQSKNEDGFSPIVAGVDYVKNAISSFATTTQHGADGPVFHVDYIGTTSDTFTNSVKDIPLKDKINTLGTAARDIRFSLAGGNLVGDTVNAVTNGVKDLIAGTASGLSYNMGSKGSGITLYGNNDYKHAGNIAFLTGQDNKGDARMIISGGANYTGGEGYRTNNDTRVTIGNKLYNFVDFGYDIGLLNLKNPINNPAIYIVGGAAASEIHLAADTGEHLKIGHWNSAAGTPEVAITIKNDGAYEFTSRIGYSSALLFKVYSKNGSSNKRIFDVRANGSTTVGGYLKVEGEAIYLNGAAAIRKHSGDELVSIRADGSLANGAGIDLTTKTHPTFEDMVRIFGGVQMPHLPRTLPDTPATLWNDGGTIKIS